MEQRLSETLLRPELQIRATRPEDRAAIEAIAAQTWEGDDYLPRVFDEWLNDPYNGFFVATLGADLVGVTKVTRLGAGEWWLEGLRVAPAYQRQGLARILHHFAVNYARQHGTGVVRFATSSLNEPVCQLASETGFERVASYVAMSAEPLAAPVEQLQALAPADLGRVRAWLDTSERFARAPRSLESEWVFYFLTDARLMQRLEAGLVFGWSRPDDATLEGVVVLDPPQDMRWPGDPTLSIAYLDAAPELQAACALDLRRLAAAQQRAYVRTKVLDRSEWLGALEAAGFERDWEGEVWLFARELDLTAHAALQVERPVEN